MEISQCRRYVFTVICLNVNNLSNTNVIVFFFSFLIFQPVQNPAEIEKIEEEKLKAKYAFGGAVGGGGGGGRPGGHSAFLQKRLQKGVNFPSANFFHRIFFTNKNPLFNYLFFSKSFLIPVIIKWQNRRVAVLNKCLRTKCLQVMQFLHQKPFQPEKHP